MALFAPGLLANVGTPDLQPGSTLRAGHGDPIHLALGRGRRLSGHDVMRLLGHEGLAAELAADRLAEISPPELQSGLTMRTEGFAVGLNVDHVVTLDCHPGQAPTSVELPYLRCENLRFPQIVARHLGEFKRGWTVTLQKEGCKRSTPARGRGDWNQLDPVGELTGSQGIADLLRRRAG
jgi:hypothetical protein